LNNLITGLVETTQSAGWVLFLALIILYASGVVFTNVVGHGLIFGTEIPPAAIEEFGSVPTSMFNLFKLMNGETDVVNPLAVNAAVKLIFVGFMITANWMVLAILTSVISDRMIRATSNADSEDALRAKRQAYEESVYRLRLVVGESGAYNYLTSSQFQAMMGHKAASKDVCESAGLSPAAVEEVFLMLARDDRVDIEEFVAKLLEESAPTTERSIFRLERAVHDAESRIQHQLEKIMSSMGIKPERDPNVVDMRRSRRIASARLDVHCKRPHPMHHQWL